MRVEIWSDAVCPWCYVGKARFEQAIRRLGWDDEIEVVYRPFELDRGLRADGVPIVEYLRHKFGSGATIEAIEGRVGEAGAELGLRLTGPPYGGRTPSTPTGCSPGRSTPPGGASRATSSAA